MNTAKFKRTAALCLAVMLTFFLCMAIASCTDKNKNGDSSETEEGTATKAVTSVGETDTQPDAESTTGILPASGTTQPEATTAATPTTTTTTATTTKPTTTTATDTTGGIVLPKDYF